ncbi:FtsH protease activity modulator HflK [Leeia sp.]|uniref:FtsH protease activity modulator HflK n=1 Tax=Leeia sp. TaxID=2884678 RepID=UPI0035B4C5F9
MSDSQWGNRGQNGPPDLDELFRRLNARIAGMFGGGKGAGPGGNGSGNAGAAGGAGLIIGVLATLWLASGFYVVDARERGVVLRFGKYHELTREGLNWHLPFPMETVEKVNLTEVRSVEIGYKGDTKNKAPEEAQMVTQDQNIIDVQLSIQYDIEDPVKFKFQNMMDGNRSESEVVKQVGEAAIREVVGRNKVDAVLNEGRLRIAADVKATVQEVLKRYQTGIRITQVNISNVQAPQQVLDAFDDATKAVQDREQRKSLGEAYRSKVVPEAEGEAAKLLAEAKGDRDAVIDRAKGDVARFMRVLPEYAKAPAVTRQRLYLDMMQQVLSNTSKVLVDQRNGGQMLYLPLDKMMNTATAPAATPVEPARTVVTPAAPAQDAARSDAGQPLREGR